MEIIRHEHIRAVRSALNRAPVVAILGPRQVGKTTLARQIIGSAQEGATVFDLEDDRDLAKLVDPYLALDDLDGLVVIDEIQRRPDLFRSLRVLADRPGQPARFLILGSASPSLLRQGSESLAGRIAFHELGGLDHEEVGMDSIDRLWYRGGFPRSFLAASDEDSRSWRRDFVRTFLERDLPALGVTIPSTTLRQFWTMLAHYHGQTWNGSELARAFGVSQPTVQRYRDLLAGAYVLRILRPWSENVGKRIVKSPKVYIRDSGILHTLLGLADRESLFGHPKVGASFEGLVVELLTRRLRAEPEECFFWATHAGAELDLLVISGDIRLGFEVKRTTSPKVTKSMTSARETLGLELVRVVHAGRDSYPLQEGFRAVSVHQLLDEVQPLPNR
jgi:hypothetical protein